VRYELKFFITFKRNSVLKALEEHISNNSLLALRTVGGDEEENQWATPIARNTNTWDLGPEVGGVSNLRQ
jgi:hypothetical protein